MRQRRRYRQRTALATLVTLLATPAAAQYGDALGKVADGGRTATWQPPQHQHDEVLLGLEAGGARSPLSVI